MRSVSLLVTALSVLVAGPALAQPLDVPPGFTVTTFSTGAGATPLVGPGGLAVNTGTTPARVVVQDPIGNGNSGDAVYAIPLSGASQGQVTRIALPGGGFSTCTVSDVTTDDRGHSYVGDVANDTVVRVAPNGTVTTAAVGLDGGGSCNDSVAIGLAFAPTTDRVYVANPKDGSLRSFDVDAFGQGMTVSATGLGTPMALTFDAKANRLVGLDLGTTTQRVFAVDLTTTVSGLHPVTTLWTAPRNVGIGAGVAVDPEGFVYFSANAAILRLDPASSTLTTFACAASRQPFKLAFGPASGGAAGRSLYLDWSHSSANFTTHDDADDAILEVRGAFSDPALTAIRPAACLLHPAELTPILEYRFDEGTGLATANTGRYPGAAGTLQNNTSTTNGPTFSTDLPPSATAGRALAFDGADDNVLVTNDFDYTTTGAANATRLSALTVEAWVKPAANNDLVRQQAVWEDYGNPGLFFGVSGGRVQVSLSTDGTPGLGATLLAGRVVPGVWQHLAAVYDGESLRVFVNGKEACASTATTGAIINNAAGSAVRIGTDNAAANALGFQGLIDEVRLYDRALEPAQLARGWFGNRGIAELDSDEDGAVDSCDACPYDAEETEPGLCGCGVPELDGDGDGVPDCRDLCPADPDPATGGTEEPGLTVAAGWLYSYIGEVPGARAFAVVPEGSAFPPGFILAVMRDYEQPDELWHLSPDGVATRLPDPIAESDPATLAFPPADSVFGDALYYTANNRDGGINGDCGGTLQRLDPSGDFEDLTPLTSTFPCFGNVFQTALTEPGGLAFGVGAFDGLALVTNSTDPPTDLYTVGPTGAVSALVADGKSTDGLNLTAVVAPVAGSDWTADAYVIDRGPACGGCLRAVTPSGLGPPLFGLVPGPLAFGGGVFGGDLLTVEAGRLVRVGVGGARTMLVTGLTGVVGDALEARGDTLYVLANGRLFALSPAPQDDADGDGAGDACDACDADPAKTEAGACGCGHPERDCSGLDGACLRGACDPSDGACVALPDNEGESCDDGLACTVGDTCAAGVCGGAAKDCSALDGACLLGVCAPESGACVAVADNEGGACDDGDACTTADACAAGVCAGAAKDCSGLDGACTEGVCDPDTGACLAAPANDGGACDDGDRCTASDVCGQGACGGQDVLCVVNDNPCAVGACDPETGGCIEVPSRVGEGCDDEDPCSVGELCQADGTCGGGTPLAFEQPADPCQVARCEPGVGVVITAGHDGASCDDGNLCTVGDTCAAGVCAGSNKDCSGLDGACVVGSCAAATGECVTKTRNEGGACDDGDACTVGDVCAAGVCGGGDKDCSAFDGACTVGVCGAGGVCAAQPKNEGGTCDDGDACTVGDVCAAGTCGGAAKDCSGLDSACAVGVCGEGGACLAEPRNEGEVCDDGNLCTVGDACAAGVCAGAAKDCSGLDGACVVGVCGDDGKCLAEASNEGSGCDDGDLCTEGDACAAGACEGALVDCTERSDGACADLTCNPERDGDGDGVKDVDDEDVTDPAVCRDVDEDSCSDCAVTGADGSGGDVADDGPDGDGDGICDAGDTDRDGDGLDNDAEAALGTDPDDADSDGDGLDDGVEVNGSGPLAEYGATDPTEGDSDGDGLGDGVEANGTGPLAEYGATDPTAEDSDGDGLGDGLEVGVGDADPATTTDPNTADTDGGGVPDGQEDTNGDGRVDAGERDPNLAADDADRAMATGGGCGCGGGPDPVGAGAVLMALAFALRRRR